MSAVANVGKVLSETDSQVDHEQIIMGFGENATWQQTIANALVITRREVRDSLRDWRIMGPIVILTLFFPFLANIAGDLFVGLFRRYGDTPEGLEEAFLPLMPMIVGFFPVSISLVIALETFVGEKERRSLEPLLSTPLTNVELYMGKVLSATIPPLMAAYLGIGLYLVGLILGPLQWRPDFGLLFLILVLTTVQAIVMVTGAVVISSQTTSTRAANLLASVIILPMSLLVIAESLIIIQPKVRHVLWYMVIGLIVVVILLVRAGSRMFNREELLGRSVDQLNLGRMFGLLIEQFTGLSHEQWKAYRQGEAPLPRINFRRWYQQSVFPALRELIVPSRVILLAGFVAFVIGLGIVLAVDLDFSGADTSDAAVLEALETRSTDIQQNPIEYVGFIIEWNTRLLLFVTLASAFSFGAMSVVPPVMTFGVMGGLLGIIIQADLNILIFIFGIVPHGIFEIPAVFIACAAALRAGAIVTRKPSEMTIFEGWLRALGDCAKLFIGLVIPLLIVGGIVEATITPEVVKWMLRW